MSGRDNHGAVVQHLEREIARCRRTDALDPPTSAKTQRLFKGFRAPPRRGGGEGFS
jgi:hypothetical protein